MKKILSFIAVVFAFAFLTACNKENEEAKKAKVEEAMEQVFKDVDLTNVSSNLNFVSKIQDVNLTYSSSNGDVISNTGEVTQQETEIDVDITVEFEYEGYKDSKIYKVTVSGKSIDTSFMDISKVKELQSDQEVKVKGIVSRIINGTEKNVPNGFYVFDKTDAIYVYSPKFAETVKAGDEVELVGNYTKYIDELSLEQAKLQGYTGARQIVPTDVKIISSNNNLPTTGIKESSIASLAKIPVSENITSNVYEVVAKVRKAQGNGFVNYYFDDLNGINSFYAYTTANGKDLGWLEQYDGEVHKCVIAVQNCKMSASGSFWRIVPLVINEKVDVSTKQYIDYSIARMLKQFSTSYEVTCNIELANTDPKLEGSKVSYEVISGPASVTNGEQNYLLSITCTSEKKEVTIKVTVEYNGESSSEEITFTCLEIKPEIETINISEARKKEKGTEVTIKGIVVGFVYLKGTSKPAGFELIDSTGSIAVFVSTAVDTKTDITKISKGEEVYVTGTKDLYQPREDNNHAGSIRLNNAEVLYHDYQNHQIPDDYIETKELSALINNPSDNNITNVVYKTTLYLEKSAGNYKNYYIHDINDPSLSMIIYSQNSGSNGVPEYEWLEQYVDKCVEAYVTLRIGAVSNKKFVWKAGVLDVLKVVETPETILGYQVSGVIKKAFLSEYTKEASASFEIAKGTLTLVSSTMDNVTLANEGTKYTVSIPAATASTNVTLVFNYTNNDKTTEITVTFKVSKVEKITIAEARNKAKKNGDTVDVEGIVIAEVRSAGAKAWGVFIADETGTMFCKQTSTAVVGDKVLVSGKLDLYYGLPQIATGATVTIISHDNTIPTNSFNQNATIDDLISANEAGENGKFGAVVWTDVAATIHVSTNRVYISVGDKEVDMYYYTNANYYAYNYQKLEEIDGTEVKLTLIAYNVYKGAYSFVISSLERIG